MRHISALSMLAAAIVLAAGCSRSNSGTQDTSATAASDSDRTVVAAKVASDIKANPAAADSILKANGYTADSFQREMYDIAADSARSAKYAAARSQ